MFSSQQLHMKVNFFRKHHKQCRILQSNPHKLGIVDRVRITTPRKPNSAKRKTVKVEYYHMIKPSVSFIPGAGHNLKKNSKVLVRGRGARDLPGVYSSCVRGKFDLQGILTKTTRRSIYGVKKPKIE